MKLVIFILLACLFFLLKYTNISERVSDENLYFYTAYLVTRGFFPYQDFFFQYLPTQILLFALLIQKFGFQLHLLKSVHLIATLGTAFLLFRVVNKRGSRKGGILAALLFLSSYVVLGTTDYALGVHEATFFLIFFWYLSFIWRLKILFYLTGKMDRQMLERQTDVDVLIEIPDRFVREKYRPMQTCAMKHLLTKSVQQYFKDLQCLVPFSKG